jgi:hypothetical protein
MAVTTPAQPDGRACGHVSRSIDFSDRHPDLSPLKTFVPEGTTTPCRVLFPDKQKLCLLTKK